MTKNLVMLSGASALAISVLMVEPAFAQEAPQAAEAPVNGEIIVTATRRAESAQKVPISMTVLDPAALARISSPTDLGKSVPNIQLEQTSGMSFQRIGIRGIAQSDFNANATTSNMIYLDELPLNAPIAQGVAIWDLARAEVLRGPQGTQFGRNATGGAIRYIVRKPGDRWEGEASATVGRFGKNEFRGAIGGPLGEKAGIRLSFLSNNTDGWAYNVLRTTRDGKEHYYGVRGVLVAEPLEAVTVELRAQYFKGGVDPVMVKSTPGLASIDGLLPAADLAALQRSYGMTGIAAQSNFYKIENDMQGLEDVEHIPISLNIDVDLGGAKLTSTTGYLSVNQRFALDDDGSPAPILNEYDFHKDKQWTQELRLASTTDGPLQWIVGGFYMHEKIDATLYFQGTEFLINFFGFDVPNGLYTRGSKTTTESYAGFGTLTYQLNDKLKLSAGGRLTHESKEITYAFRGRHQFATSSPRTSNEVFDFIKAVNTGNLGPRFSFAGDPVTGKESWNNFSWNLALNYQASNQVLLYGLVSRGFKGGSFQPNANLPSQVVDASGKVISVKPETITNFEAGIKADVIPGKLRVNASGFYYDYSNYQTNQFIAAIAGQLLSSLPKARVVGAELEIRAEPVRGLVFAGGLGITDAKITKSLDPALEGNKLPLAEDFNANGSISYRFETPIGSFIPEGSFKYRGKYFTNKDNDRQLGNFATFDAQIGYESPGKGIYGSVWVRNLTDERRPIAVDDAFEFFGGDFAYISPPKMWGVTIGARY